MRWGIIAALVLGCGFCAADEIDLEAVRGTLDTAVDTYFEEIIELDKEITERIDKLIEMAGNRGDLDDVEELQRQREAYLRTGFMPEGRIHLVTRRKAEFGINRAKSRLDQAYEVAIENLTKKGRYTDARRIKNERLSLEQKLTAAQPELQPTNIISQARERLDPIQKQPKEQVASSDVKAAANNIPVERCVVSFSGGNFNDIHMVQRGYIVGGNRVRDNGDKWDVVGGFFDGKNYVWACKLNGTSIGGYNVVFSSLKNGLLISDFHVWPGRKEPGEIVQQHSTHGPISINELPTKASFDDNIFRTDICKKTLVRWSINGNSTTLVVCDNTVLGGSSQTTDSAWDVMSGGIFGNGLVTFFQKKKNSRFDQFHLIVGRYEKDQLTLTHRISADGQIEDLSKRSEYKDIKFQEQAVTEDDSTNHGTSLQADPAYTNSIGMKLRAIPPGTFLMQGTTKATITKPFYIGVYEVTQKEWKAVMGSLPENTKTEGDDMPAQGVSWNSAAEFCQKLSNMPDEKANGCVYRLPTETEWEYACRAGTSTEYFFGDDASKLGEYAWYHDNSEGHIHPVGTKHPNPAGLYDINGNVIEWCIDWYNEFPPVMVDYVGQNPKLTGHGSKSKVVRGASFIKAAECSEVIWRDVFPPEYEYDFNGLRVVMTKQK